MDCFIKKIFDSRIDENVHQQFQKFSRGNFEQRALIKASISPKEISLSTGSEFANEIVFSVAEKLGAKKTQVNGVIVSTQKLDGKVPSTGLKQFMGIKQYIINGEMSGQEIMNLITNLPDAFFALSFSSGTSVLKVKPKAPKSAKPKTSGEPPKADFCSLKTEDKTILDGFVFEKNWKKIEINHTFIINDIELPKDVSDPNMMRKLAKRKGIIVRKAMIDGKEHVSEKAFSA